MHDYGTKMIKRGEACFAPPVPTDWPLDLKWAFNDIILAAVAGTSHVTSLNAAITVRESMQQLLDKWPEHGKILDTATVIALTCESIVAYQRVQYELEWAKVFLLNESTWGSLAEVSLVPYT